MANKSPHQGNIGGVMFNKTRNLIWLMISLFAVLIVSCSPSPSTPQAPADSENMIKPGDMIGEMVVRKAADESEARRFLKDLCGWEDLALAELSEDKSVECIIAYEPAVFMGYGMEEPNLDKLNEYWANLTWEISINGRPLDLEAFGTIDKSGGRWWNVLFENPASDPIQIVTVMTTHEDPIEMYGLTLDLTVEAAD
jgi:hypothetical protein